MDLPVMPPVKPMLARAVAEIPAGMLYEPKWDGFRALVFRDGDELEITSRNTKSMTRYFPELVEDLRAVLPGRCVLDGEIVVVGETGLEFEVLQQRVHPASSRVTKLAAETPVSFIAFDLLALGDESLVELPFARRRARLAELLPEPSGPRPAGPTKPGSSPGTGTGTGTGTGAGSGPGPAAGPAGSDEPGGRRRRVHLTPATDDVDLAGDWFDRFEGAGLDGIIAKPADGPYEPDRRAMFKIKHDRTADCVLAGYRPHKSGPDAVGSLLLGLYPDPDDPATDPARSGLLAVGVSSAFTMARRRELVGELAELVVPIEEHPWTRSGGGGSTRTPWDAGESRWAAGKDLSFVPLRPERVLEVRYDHMEGPRFRHTTQFVRWRPDREPASCTFAQLDRPVRFDLADVLR